ncbi:DUF58 domain-containing protein [Sphingomonas hengshuiensis]|uniref:DUF58 domain-containing protein n=1 Tax=Sphingomonas hengshuiensis TaxID=1609977 RepID=A0A7U4LGH9_9SPHN|nr:DUF58 domain-containing protein [Sphingomonas hengshuiensis]AJP73199.1 hypothetical protein TS85_17490 [Sphingomonas hengshuiensis]
MIRPTRQSVMLMAAGAPLALLVGVALPQIWAIGLVWIPLILALVALDALLAAAPPQIDIACPGAVEIGAPLLVDITLSAAPPGLELALATGPRLRPRGADTIRFAPGERQARIAFDPVRRGTDGIASVWSRWTGPLRLVWRQRVETLDRRIVVTPDIRPVREAAAMLLRDAQAGEMARVERGEGSEFEALAEWRSGMERRTIDWKASARHHKLFARENRIERNNQIVFAIDAGRVMCEPVAGLPRIDRAISAALLAAYSALRLGDRVALFGFDSKPRIASGAVSGTRAFPLMQRLAGELDYSTAETNFTLALATLAGDLTRRSLVVVFTEFTDQAGAELMIRAAASLMGRHLVLFVVLNDVELESIAAAEPRTIDDVSRAVTAAAMLRERRIVVSRLRRLGIHVLEAAHDAVGPALVRQYLDFKRRNLL